MKQLHLLQDSLEAFIQALYSAQELNELGEIVLIQKFIDEFQSDLEESARASIIEKKSQRLKQDLEDRYDLRSILQRIESALL